MILSPGRDWCGPGVGEILKTIGPKNKIQLLEKIIINRSNITRLYDDYFF